MVLFCLLFESFLISWIIHWFRPLYFTCFLSNSVWSTFLGASFRAFCIKLWLITRTHSCLAGLMLFGSASCIPIHFAWHALWLCVANVTLPICQHERDSWVVFVIGASLVLSYFSVWFCSDHKRLHASDTQHSVTIQILYPNQQYWEDISFCMLVIKKKWEMHACYFFSKPPQPLSYTKKWLCFSQHVLPL